MHSPKFKPLILFRHWNWNAEIECLLNCHCLITVLRCDTVEPATMNDRSLAALDAEIDRISLAKVDKRGSEGELTRHQILTGSK